MTSSAAIVWMCLSLLAIYVALEAVFGNRMRLRRRPALQRVEVEAELGRVHSPRD